MAYLKEVRLGGDTGSVTTKEVGIMHILDYFSMMCATLQ